MSVLRKLEPARRCDLQILFVAGLLYWTSLSSQLPVLPLYIADQGASQQQVGWVMGTFALGLLLTRAWFGRLADQRSRKLVLQAGMLAVAIAPLGYLLLPSLPTMMVFRSIHGLSLAAFTTAYIALAIDFAPPQHRGELISLMTLVNPVAVAMGPAIGGFLQSWVGYTPLFLIAASLGLLGLLCLLRVRESMVPGVQQTTPTGSPPNQRFWMLLGSPLLRVPAFILLLIGISFGAISAFVPLFIQATGADLNVGLFYTAAAIASFSTRLVVGPASDRLGRGLFITMSLILYGTAMVLLCTAHNGPTFLVAGLFEGAGFGILIPMFSTLIADRSQPQERARFFSLCMTGFDLGLGVAGPVLGGVAEQMGYRNMFGWSAALVLVALTVFMTQSNKNMSQSLRFSLGQGRDLYAVN